MIGGSLQQEQPLGWAEEVVALREVWGRAPSAHNTQPWVLTAEDDRLLLSWDPARELVVTDPTRRDLWLSLGALAESVVIAAGDADHDLDVSWAIDARTHQAAVIRRRGDVRDDRRAEDASSSAAAAAGNCGGEGPASGRSRFASDDLLARRCARGPYLRPFADEGEIDRVAAAAGLGDLSLSILPAKLVERLLPQADRWTYSTPAQVDELRRWLRLGAGHPAYELDGLSDAALALSTAQARALRITLSTRVWPALSRLGGPAILAKAGVQQDLGTVVAVHASESTAEAPEAVSEAGRTLLRVWLSAGRAGLRVHPLSQLIDAPAVADHLHAALPGSHRRALSVFRIGVPARQPTRSARRI
ncbi:MAG: hypothetical protein V9G19_25450 [Tetrasphaera sp.]